MDTLAKADIFFFITTIAVIVFTAGFIAIFIYLMKILHDIRSLVEKVRSKTDEVFEDIEDFTDNMRKRRARSPVVSRIIRLFVKALFGRRKRKGFY